MPAELKQNDDLGERDHDLEQALIIALFIKWYGTMLTAIHTISVQALGVTPVGLDDPSVRQMVLEAQGAAVAVDAATQKLIAQRIAEGLALGLTAKQIAYGTDDFAGIDGLFEETWKNRPLTVARTEMQKAMLAASINRFRQLGRGIIGHLLISDGDFDAFCAARNGTTVPISQAPSLAHPNCRLSVSPVP